MPNTSDSDLICVIFVVTTCAEQGWITQGQSLVPYTPLHTSAAPLFSSAEYLQEWEKTLVLIETKSASLMAAVSSPGCHAGCILLEQRKSQNAAAEGLVQAGAEHHRAQPAVWSVWGLLLGLCAPHCPCGHPAFCSPSPALGTGSAHAHCHGLRCPLPSSFLRFGALLPKAAIMCKKEEEGKTSTARIRIILLQPSQETDCKSSCI